MIEGIKTELNEQKRIYTFPTNTVILNGVTELIVRPSGTHRLKTLDGKLHIIPTGWVHIEIDSKEWKV